MEIFCTTLYFYDMLQNLLSTLTCVGKDDALGNHYKRGQGRRGGLCFGRSHRLFNLILYIQVSNGFVVSSKSSLRFYAINFLFLCIVFVYK